MTDNPVIDMPRPDTLASGPVQEPPGDPHGPEREVVVDQFVFADTSLTRRETEDDFPHDIWLDDFAVDDLSMGPFGEAEGTRTEEVSFYYEKLAYVHNDVPEPIDFWA